MALTTAQKLDIASISEYLCYADIAKGGLYFKGIDRQLPLKIYNIRKSVAYWYDLDPSDDTLITTSNYLIALCGIWGLKAQEIVTSAGTIASISATTPPTPLQFIVAASGTTFIDGQSSATLTSFIGYNLLFARGGIPQSTVSSEPSYYSWDKNTGALNISPDAATGELFQIYPV